MNSPIRKYEQAPQNDRFTYSSGYMLPRVLQEAPATNPTLCLALLFPGI